MPTSDGASASGPQPGPYPCASVDGCDFSHLAPSDQHRCNGGCQRPTHNLCNQKLRGNHDQAPDGIKCGWIVCAAGYNEQQKAELLVKLRQLREEAAAKAAAKAAEVEQQGGGCAAGENCLVPDGDPDKLTVDCAHGRKKHFKCQNRDCSSTCAADETLGGGGDDEHDGTASGVAGDSGKDGEDDEEEEEEDAGGSNKAGGKGKGKEKAGVPKTRRAGRASSRLSDKASRDQQLRAEEAQREAQRLEDTLKVKMVMTCLKDGLAEFSKQQANAAPGLSEADLQKGILGYMKTNSKHVMDTAKLKGVELLQTSIRPGLSTVTKEYVATAKKVTGDLTQAKDDLVAELSKKEGQTRSAAGKKATKKGGGAPAQGGCSLEGVEAIMKAAVTELKNHVDKGLEAQRQTNVNNMNALCSYVHGELGNLERSVQASLVRKRPEDSDSSPEAARKSSRTRRKSAPAQGTNQYVNAGGQFVGQGASSGMGAANAFSAPSAACAQMPGSQSVTPFQSGLQGGFGAGHNPFQSMANMNGNGTGNPQVVCGTGTPQVTSGTGFGTGNVQVLGGAGFNGLGGAVLSAASGNVHPTAGMPGNAQGFGFPTFG